MFLSKFTTFLQIDNSWVNIVTFKKKTLKSRKSKGWKLKWVNVQSIEMYLQVKNGKIKLYWWSMKSRSFLTDSPPFICLVPRITLPSRFFLHTNSRFRHAISSYLVVIFLTIAYFLVSWAVNVQIKAKIKII